MAENRNGNGKLFFDPNARQLMFLNGKTKALANELRATVIGNAKIVKATNLLQEVGNLLEMDAKYRERKLI